MLLFPQHRLFILAVPKTGTTGLAQLLAPRAGINVNSPPQAKHIGLAQVQRRILPLLGPSGGEYRSFALIREPLDWLGSWYRYRLREQFAGRPDSTAGVSFADFVRGYLRKSDRPRYANLGRQSWFMKDRDDKFGIDALFRYEAEPVYMDFLSEIFGEKLTTERWNVSPQAALDLPQNLRSKVEQELAEDYGMWESAGH